MSKASGPEKLDERIRVVTVSGWISLAIAVVVVFALLAWAALGTTSEEVTGQALVVRSPHAFLIETPVQGTVIQAPPPVGTQVRRGQRLATIRVATDPDGELLPILASVTGTVISNETQPGTSVRSGQDLAYLSLAGAPLVAQVFVPTSDGKRVEAGMRATIEPSVATSARYGLLKATVRSVSRLSMSPDLIQTITGNPVLAKQIVDGPPVLLVTLDLTPGTGGHQFDWTSGNGPPFTIESGTLANATIVISTSRPLDALFSRSQS
jgi:hypothetical protein